MSVALMQKDLFVDFEAALAEGPTAENITVRRPLYGMNTKEPAFAWIGVFQDQASNGSVNQPISLVDSSSVGGYSSAAGNHNFILQKVNQQQQERVQIIETFGDHFAFFYGEKPIVLSVQGALFNTEDFNWKNEFLANYNRFLRGTRCVENQSRVFLGWDDVVAQGYLLNVSVEYSATNPNFVPFGFSMLLTKPPLDLSLAINAVDAPKLNSRFPSSYRTLENSGTIVEYLNATGPVDTLSSSPFYGVEPDGTVVEKVGDIASTVGQSSASAGSGVTNSSAVV